MNKHTKTARCWHCWSPNAWGRDAGFLITTKAAGAADDQQFRAPSSTWIR